MATVIRESNLKDYTLKVQEYVQKGYVVVNEGQNFPRAASLFLFECRVMLPEKKPKKTKRVKDV